MIGVGVIVLLPHEITRNLQKNPPVEKGKFRLRGTRFRGTKSGVIMAPKVSNGQTSVLELKHTDRFIRM